MSERKILVLGAGMVMSPCVEYLSRDLRNTITIACRSLSTSQKLAHSLLRATCIRLDVSSSEELDAQVAAHDVVISLVPFMHHPKVIRSAIKGKTHVVTTSYISAEVRELEEEAKTAGIVVLNEVGLDPGIDHLYAVKTIGEVHAKGGKVKAFYSFCGGLPAPECADNPLKFKFSWSPRGALLSQCNSATYLSGGAVVEIPSTGLMASAKPFAFAPGYNFVSYPNRDSVPFREYYDIPEAHTVIRGSVRYEGNPPFVDALKHLGWLDTARKGWLRDGLTWAEAQQKVTGAAKSDEASLVSRVKDICGDQFSSKILLDRIIAGLRWMGLFSDRPATVRESPLDTLCAQLEQLISFQPGERDLVVMQHKFVVVWRDGKQDTLTSSLELLGDPNGYSAMARLVGTTCSIATQLLLDGHPALNTPGVLAPYTKAICDPIRVKLDREDITMVESRL